ncbi:MAG: helix-turn-helix domain-containing protein [Clostridia bacterium]|nr:helix-turn-helix domain-containing protein [Clostridia bacterium]
MKEIRIGQNIAGLRKNSHTTQDQLAQALHISSQAVSKWENGVNYPDTPTMARIAEYFRVSIDFLYYGKAEAEMDEHNYTGIRAKNLRPNHLIYDYWKEEDLNALTDEEFELLRQKVTYEITSIAHRSEEFEHFFAGKDGESIRGDGNAADFRIYRYKSMADNLLVSELFSLYERLFTFASRIGVRHIFDIGCMPSFQASYLVHHPEMHYTGIDEQLFAVPIHIEESYVNRVFESFTGSDRIKYVKENYPCELDVPENSIAFCVWKRRIPIVEWEEELLLHLASQFDRFVIEMVAITNNSDLAKMDVKDVVRRKVDNFMDIRGEQMMNLRRLLPEYEFYTLRDHRQSFIVYATKIRSDRETILSHYDLIGDRIVSDAVDAHWIHEMDRMITGTV